MSYVLLCGASAAELTRISRSPGAIAGVVRENARQMQQAAKELREAGVPVRDFLAPYVDTVQLQNDSAAFFGSRMLIVCDPAKLPEFRRICAAYPLLRFYAAEALPQLFKTHPLTPQRRALLQKALEQYAEPAESLAVFSFSAPPLCDCYAKPMVRRAQSREVLAFGEICARLAKNAGSELISCAGGELVLRSDSDVQQELLQKLTELYEQRMAPYCGAAAKQPALCIVRQN